MDNSLEILGKIVEQARMYTDPFRPQWKSRADAIRTLLSLASTALVFSITFATSVIKPWSSPFWRWGVVVSWAMLTVSLLLSLAALWFSINLEDLPLLIIFKHKELRDAITLATTQSKLFDDTDIPRIFHDAERRIMSKNKYSQKFFHAALITFGIALLIFTIIGILQVTTS